MSLLLTLWRYLKRAGRAIRALFDGVVSFFRELITTMFEGPVGGLERLVRKILELLSRLLDLLRNAWLRIWAKAPPTPGDKSPTLGREVIPLLASTATTTVWYLFPLAERLDLSRGQFRGALAATWVLAVLMIRASCRREPTRRVGSWLIATRHRTGLIWFERTAFLALTYGWLRTSSTAQASPAPFMLALGFLVLMASPYRDRGLTDDLPEIAPLSPPEAESGEEPEKEEATATELRAFRWSVSRATRTEALDITVAVDPELVATMASTNPKRPTGGTYPDWTPWVIAGTSPEVSRAAHEIRELTNERGFSRFEEAAAVLGFAQSIDYQSDIDTTGEDEYWRYPIETIFEQVGDCEDSSILAAAVLVELGHQVLPLVTKDHAALGVVAPVGLPGTYVEYEGHRYYYCETTAAGFRIGQLPSEVRADQIRICPLRDVKA